MVKQLNANGGNATTAFTKLTKLSFVNATQFPSKFCRWYFSPLSAGYVPTTLAIDSCKGAGEGKVKYATAPMPNFILLTQFTQPYNQFNQFPYDLRRMTVDSIYDWLDCGYSATVNLKTAASDGIIVGSTMWKFGSVLTSVGNDASGIPNTFTLNQNYPNPFNPSTKIEYTLQNTSNVTLRVYNVLGQVVATLVSEKQDGGSHSVTFDASKFTSGVYFYQIKAGNYTATRKMLLVK
jgi:hypothetical protein